MKESKFSLEKIKNWFIILGIKLANFIKEHKYVSAGIGVLICTCIIVMVAFASDTDPNEGKISVDSLSVKASNESDEITEAQSFSTINYTVNFNLFCEKKPDDEGPACTKSKTDDTNALNRKAVIEASIPSEIDAEWVNTNNYETPVEIVKEGDFNTIILTISDGIYIPENANENGKQITDNISKTLRLNVKNVKNDTVINPTITVYEATALADDKKSIDVNSGVPTITVNSTEVPLTSKIVGGYKYLDNNFRYVPFGVILGYEGDSLTGKYFNPNQSVSVKGTLGEEFVTDKEKFGVYDATKNNFVSKDKMPHYIYNPSLSNYVYDSGSATFAKKSDTSSNEYSLDVTGLKSDGYTDNYKDGNFIKLGSYYVTAKTSTDKESITVNIGNESYTMDNLTTEDVGTQTIDAILTTGSDSSEETLKTLSYGEAANLNVKFTHSIDSSNDLNSIDITVPINENFDFEKYSSKSDYNINEDYKNDENNPKRVTTLYVCSGEGTGESFEDAMDNNKNPNCGGIKSVTFTIKGVKRGSNVNIDLRLKVKNNASAGNLTYEKVSVSYSGTTKESVTDNEVVITPLKARAKVAINGKETDTVVDMSNSNTTNIKVYPSIYAPAALLNSTAIQEGSLNFVMVQVDLPEGVEYVSGSSNIEVIIPNGTSNRLIYFIEYASLGDTIKSISFDTRPSINLSGEKQIKVKVQALSLAPTELFKYDFNYFIYLAYKVNVEVGKFKDIDEVEGDIPNVSYKDYSSVDYRTLTKNITFQNNSSNLIYRNNALKLYVDKDTPFDFETEVYNPSENDKTFDLILKLPEKGSEDTSYTGSYTVTNIPENALCAYTYEQVSDANWEECPDEITDSSVKLIKLSNITLNKTNNYYKTSMTITPEENKVGDKYRYSSTIIEDDNSKNISAVTTSVYSKRITGNVWEDFNDNGLIDEDETKIEGIEFSLHKVTYKEKSNEFETDDIVATTKSNYKGDYEFLSYDDGSDIEKGYYYIEAKYYNQKYGLTAYREDISNEYSKSVFKAINEDSTEETEYSSAKTEVFEVKSSTNSIVDKNLGLTLKKVYNIKISKYLTKAVTTNALGISTTKEFGDKVTFAKLDVKDINNLTIKVIYTIEVQNTGYYPGYVSAINDYMPDGMSFNKDYEENKNWVLNDNGTLVYDGLKDTLIKGSEKKYVTLALDITSKEAGSFVNYASVTNDDIKIFSRNNDLLESGDTNE